MKYNIKEVKALNEKFDRKLANEMVTKRRDELMKKDAKLTKKEARKIAWIELKEARESLKQAKRKYKSKYDRSRIMKEAWKLARQLGKNNDGKFEIGEAIKKVWEQIKVNEELMKQNSIQLRQSLDRYKGLSKDQEVERIDKMLHRRAA